MSMSALGDQLAALSSSSGKSTSGVVRPTSRADGDGIGRGFRHSNRHGHALVGGDATRQPSVLYENAREAAEVASVTLRENAVAAWKSLANEVAGGADDGDASAVGGVWNDPEFVGSRGLLSRHQLANFERGTATASQNSAADESIERMMRLLMTAVCERPPPPASVPGDGKGGNAASDNPTLLACLHVVEYLLRHYSIHAYPRLSSLLLTTLLPLQIAFGTAYPGIFARALSLVDLQSAASTGSGGEWAVFRKYAARGAPPLTGGALAKYAARDDALVKIVADVGRSGMETRLAERGGGADAGSRGRAAPPARRGIGALLSFSASVLVEALRVQSLSTDAGGVKESTVRTLLPLTLSACRGGGRGTDHCPEWKEWGRLLASTMSASCPLSEEVGVALCDAVADGLPRDDGDAEGKEKSFREVAESTNNSDNDFAAAFPSEEVDDASSAVMTLLSILGAMNNEDEDDGGWERYLPMLPPAKKKSRKKKRAAAVIDYLGCNLPSSTYKKLLANKQAASSAMGAVCKSLEGSVEDEPGVEAREGIGAAIVDDRMAPLIASIVMHAFARVEKEAAKALASSTIDDAGRSPASKKKRKKSKKGKGGDGGAGAPEYKADRDVIFILRLIKDPSLSSLWSSRRFALVAAVTVRAVSSYDDLRRSRPSSDPADAEPSSTAMIRERYSSILKALSNIKASVYDRGVAYAVNSIVRASKNGSESKEGCRNVRLSHLAKLLGRDDTSFVSKYFPPKGEQGAASGNEATAMDADATASALLPARVALEHAAASVRLDAIGRLKKSMVVEGDDGDAASRKIMGDDDLGRALLRRLGADDDPEVASAAGQIVADALKTMCLAGGSDSSGDGDMEADEDGNLLFTALVENDLDSLAKEALLALIRWTGIGKEEKDGITTPSSPILSCISVCGSVAKLILDKNIQASDDLDDPMSRMFCMLFASLGAHVQQSNSASDKETSNLMKEVSDAASAELLQLFNDEEGALYGSVANLMTANPTSQKVLTNFFSVEGTTTKRDVRITKILQARFLWLALTSYSDAIAAKGFSVKKKSASASNSTILQITFNLAQYQMRLYSQESKKSDRFESDVSFLRETCSRYLNSPAIFQNRDIFERAIIKLASISSNVSYKEIAEPSIALSLCHDADKEPNLVHGGFATVLVNACLLPHASTEGIARILAIITSSSGNIKMDSRSARDCLLPTLALLSHSDRGIREYVLGLLKQYPSLAKKKDEMLSDICSVATNKSSPLWSSLVLDGANALPSLLAQIVQSSQRIQSQKFLIESCKSCALDENGDFTYGGCQAASVIFSSMEKAGEEAFPLLKRWDLAGKDLFQAFLAYDRANNDVGDEVFPELSLSLTQLRDFVTSMLKGVLVNKGQGGDDNIQISIGPSSTGRRMRTYSVGASNSFTVLEPYPDDMLCAIIEGLTSSVTSSTPLLLSTHVVQLVISRQSWANGVFPNLSQKSKHDVASALLALRAQGNEELAGLALQGLPLKSLDFIQLLGDVNSPESETDQAALVFITDCIRGKLKALSSTASDISKLSSELFDQLLSLSSVKCSSKGGDTGGRDYTRVSLLHTLLAIHSHYKSELKLMADNDGRSKHHGSASKRKRIRSYSDVGSSPKTLTSHANLLVGLVGGNASSIHPLNSGRGRALSLSLLTCLCEESPSAVVSSLLPALMSMAGASPSTQQGTTPTHDKKKVDTKALGDALVAIVPAYCAHAPSAGLSLFSLLKSFVGRIIVPDSESNENLRYNLLDHLVNALKLLPTKEISSDAIASLAACVMAVQAFQSIQKPKMASDGADTEMSNTEESNFKTRLDIHVLNNTTHGIKIAVALSLLQYAEKLMSYVCDGLSVFPVGEESSMRVPISEVATLALHGNEERATLSSIAAYSKLFEAQQRSILYLTVNLLQTVRDALSTPAARRIVRKSKGGDADLCLRLWNELLQTHTSAVRAQHAKLADGYDVLNNMEKKFWDAAPLATSECLDSLQTLLPIPHFLASVSSILTDDDEDTCYIYKKKIIRLLADRVAEVSSDSPEASLFLEMIPDLVAQVNIEPAITGADGEDSLTSTRRIFVMKQVVLVAVESFVRSLYPSNESSKLTSNAAVVFLPALASVIKLLDKTASAWINSNENGDNRVPLGVVDAQCQLLSSSSLCVSTLVTTLKARCLPQLPTMIKPLVTSLKSVNAFMEGSDEKVSSTGELLQLSILKTLQSIAETIPQFLPPYLSLIFSENSLPSMALRRGGHSVKAAAMQVETALAIKVQVRQLIPALGQGLSRNLQSGKTANWEEASSIINVMNIAVESSQRSELSPIIGKIFNGLVMAYGHEGGDESSSQMLRSANKCLLSLVMKLSEVQLRPLYARLREWRGDIENSTAGSVPSTRRYAFWSLSAELSKSLKSIFLPCLTSVLSDIIDELEIAVSLLCQRSKKDDGSKRRRVDESQISGEDVDRVKPLQPLLLCLDSALKADAHEGGNWTRGDDNQRYNMILNHLGKLLLAQVPKEIPLLSDLTSKEQASTSAFQQLIQGVGTLEYGNVVGCLTSLAAAVGNEQLWKPLNFAVLEACGHKRSEVRKAGITCLLSIIETIGEEYMVLLPECLPVISELLEDEEEIAAMAKDCVRQGEELLGESLEDSLR